MAMYFCPIYRPSRCYQFLCFLLYLKEKGVPGLGMLQGRGGDECLYIKIWQNNI